MDLDETKVHEALHRIDSYDELEATLACEAIRLSCLTPPPSSRWILALHRTCLVIPESHDRLALIRASLLTPWIASAPLPMRAQCVLKVLLAVEGRTVALWREQLAFVSQEWPEWREPWFEAAAYFTTIDDLRTARDYLLHAYSAHWIASSRSLKVADALFTKLRPQGRYRREPDNPDRNNAALDVAGLIASDVPSLTNLARLANTAWVLRNWLLLDFTLRKCQQIHGLTPDKWVVVDEYDAHSGAGSLCALHVRRCANTRRACDYSLWNKYVIHFLMTALRISRSTSDLRPATYTLLRLGDTLASLEQNLTPAAIEESGPHVGLIHEITRELGQIPGGAHYAAERQRTQFAIGRTQRSRRNGHDSATIDSLTHLASHQFESLEMLSYAGKKPQIVDWHLSFLIKLKDYPAALIVAKRSQHPLVSRARVLHAKGSRQESIKSLLKGLALAERVESIVYVNALSECYTRDPGGFSYIPDALTHRVYSALKPFLGWLISKVTNALDRGRLKECRKMLALVSRVDSPSLSPNVVHLWCRYAQARWRPPRLIPTSFSRKLKELLLGVQTDWDTHLHAAYIYTMSRTRHVSDVEAEKLWKMALRPGEEDGHCDAINISQILKLELRESRLDSLMTKLLTAVHALPPDRFLNILPARSLRRHGTAALAPLSRLMECCIQQQAHQAWASEWLDQMPGHFFNEDSIVKLMDPLVGLTDGAEIGTAKSKLMRVFIRGRVRHQLEAPDVGKMYEAAKVTAKWMLQNPDPVLRSTLVAEWLGSERGVLQRLVGSEVSHELINFRETILRCLREKRGMPISVVEAFLSNPWDREQASGGQHILPDEATTLLDYLKKASESFSSERPNPNYWKELQRITPRLLELKTTSSELLTAVWCESVAVVKASVRKQLWSTVVIRIHNFKNTLGTPTAEATLTCEEMVRLIADLRKSLFYLKSFRRPSRELVELAVIINFVTKGVPFVRSARSRKGNSTRFYVGSMLEACPVIIDRKMIGHLLYALTHNAFKSVEKLGSAGWVSIETILAQGIPEIRIRDNGVGATTHIVDQMNHALAAPFTGLSGTGIGLRVCHNIARLHGLTLIFSSDGPGLGMCALVRFECGADDDS